MRQFLSDNASLQIVLVDSYQICLTGTIELLKTQYPNAQIISVQTAKEALYQISNSQPHLMIMDIFIPHDSASIAKTNTGIQFLQNVMQKYPHLNICVQSTYIKRLVEMRQTIDAHKGGFTIADKSLKTPEMLARVDWALQGLTYIKEIKDIYAEFQIKPEILQLITLAFHEGLQDKAIAAHICVSERMVRHYWDKLQAALGIDAEELKHQGKNIRIITKIRAREAGLID